MRAIRSTQMNWFINALINTPSGYKVVVALHNTFSENAIAQANMDFSQKNFAGEHGSSTIQNHMQNDIFKDIINAFINKATYNDKIVFTGDASYMNVLNDGNIDYAYELSADFSNVSASFMCYIGGHVHRDLVWKTTNNIQYQVSPILASSIHPIASSFADIRREKNDGYAKDCLTTISFRNDANSIVLNKIGVDVTDLMEDRVKQLLQLNQ